MSLDQGKKGQTVLIIKIPEGVIKAQSIRFGLEAGEEIYIAEVISNGPIIVRKNNQEIAIGRKLAQNIEIQRRD